MKNEEPIRAGDTVKVSGEIEYVAATDEDANGYFHTAGWPPGEVARGEVIEVTGRADDEQRENMLRDVAKSRGTRGEFSSRARRATHLLMEIDRARILSDAQKARSSDIFDHMVEVTEWAHRKGWDKPPVCAAPGMMHRNSPPIDFDVQVIGTKLALVHSEISEALEELREGRLEIRFEGEKNKPEGMVVELADAYIRIVHLCGMLGLDLPAAIEAKRAYNEGRPIRHGGKLA